MAEEKILDRNVGEIDHGELDANHTFDSSLQQSEATFDEKFELNSKLDHDQLRNKPNPDIHIIEEVKAAPLYNNKPIKIAVIGATGAGKSALCNLICDELQNEYFKTGCGFADHTLKTKSYSFPHFIGNKLVQFEIIDSPGFIHPKEKYTFFSPLYMSELQKDIKKKWKGMNKGGIAAYLLVIPYEPLSKKQKDSIEFVSSYFSAENLNRVWVVFTKTKGVSTENILKKILSSNEPNESKLAVMKLLKKIGRNRCMSVDSVKCNADQSAMSRDVVLSKAFYTYEAIGKNQRCGMLEAIKTYENSAHYWCRQLGDGAVLFVSNFKYLFGGT